jgi:hypothetical protein
MAGITGVISSVHLTLGLGYSWGGRDRAPQTSPIRPDPGTTGFQFIRGARFTYSNWKAVVGFTF